MGYFSNPVLKGPLKNLLLTLILFRLLLKISVQFHTFKNLYFPKKWEKKMEKNGEKMEKNLRFRKSAQIWYWYRNLVWVADYLEQHLICLTNSNQIWIWNSFIFSWQSKISKFKGQCPRTDLNKRFLPRPKTIRASKLISHRSKISKKKILLNGSQYMDFSKTEFH